MKKILFSLILISFLIVSVSMVGVVNARLDSNVKLYWTGNGSAGSTTITDLSQYAHTITSNGASAPSVDTTNKQFGTGAITFPGTANNNVTVAASSDWNFPADGNFSFSYWQRMETTGGHQLPFLFGNFADFTSLFHAGNDELDFRYPGTTTGGSIKPFSPFYTKWNYFSWTHTGTTMRTYMNGTLVNTVTNTPANDDSAQRIIFSGYGAGDTYPYKGQIDDVVLRVGGMAVDGTVVPSVEFVNNPTVSALTANVTVGQAPFSFTFNPAGASTGNALTSHQWNATDVKGTNIPVTILYSQTGSYTFNSAGNYSITYAGTNTFGTDITPKTQIYWVNVSSGTAVPIVQWIIDKTQVRVPGSVTVNDTSLNTPTSWQYYWGDGTANSTANNNTHKYVKRGIYQVSLNATNSAGSNTSVAKTVRVIGYDSMQGLTPGGLGIAETCQYSVSRVLDVVEKAMTDCKLCGVCE